MSTLCTKTNSDAEAMFYSSKAQSVLSWHSLSAEHAGSSTYRQLMTVCLHKFNFFHAALSPEMTSGCMLSDEE